MGETKQPRKPRLRGITLAEFDAVIVAATAIAVQKQGSMEERMDAAMLVVHDRTDSIRGAVARSRARYRAYFAVWNELKKWFA